MSLATALLAAAVLAWPMPHPAPLAWPQPPGPEAPSATVRGRWSGRGLSRRRRAAQDAADLLAVVEAVLPALEAGLTPGAALGLAAGGAPARSRPPSTPLLVSRLGRPSAPGGPLGQVWAGAARATQGAALR